MPRILREKSTGDRFVLGDDGSTRPATADDLASLAPRNVRQAQGVTSGERFILKNFSSNPGAAKAYLRSIGYYVADLDSVSGFNFAVQKRTFDESGQQTQLDPDGWKVVDPKGFSNPLEFFKDILDLTTDVAEGVAVGAAATAGALGGGLLGGAAAAGGAGFVAAGARQAAGSALGIPENIDPAQAALVGGLSAAVPVAGAAFSRFAKPIVTSGLRMMSKSGKIPATVAARIMGLGDQASFVPSTGKGLDAAETTILLMERGADFKVERPDQLIRFVRDHLDTIAKTGWDEAAEVGKVLSAQGNAKIIDIGSAARELSHAIQQIDIQDVTAVRLGAALTDEISSLLGRDITLLRGAGGRFTGKAAGGKLMVTAHEAQSFKLSIQGAASARGVFAGKVLKEGVSVPVRFKTALGRSGNLARRAMEDVLNPRAGNISFTNSFRANFSGNFGQLNHRLSEMIRVRNVMKDHFGAGIEAAESNILNAFGKGKFGFLEDLTAYERFFGTNISNRLRQVVATSEIARGAGAKFGEIPPLGKFTATGQFLGPSLIAGGAGGFIGGKEGGPLGAITGFGIGATVASPRFIIGAGRQALKARPLLKAMGKLGDTLGSAQASPLQQTAAKGMAQQMAKRLELFSGDRPVVRGDSPSAKEKELRR